MALVKAVVKRSGATVLWVTCACVLAACKPEVSEQATGQATGQAAEQASKQAPVSRPEAADGKKGTYLFPFELERTDDTFKTTLSKAMREAGLQHVWENHGILRSGPESRLEPVMLSGVTWLLSTGCQAHNCAAHNIIYLYQPDTQSFVGIYRNESAKQLIGNPDAEQLKALENG